MKNELVEVEKQIEEARAELIDVPSSVNTVVNKELLAFALSSMKDEMTQLRTIENNQNANVKKVLGTYDKAIVAITSLLEKDVVTDEERKYYISLADKHLNSVKEILANDREEKRDDKNFLKNLIKIGGYTLSASVILAMVGRISLSIIKSLKK